jgi:peptidoglycan/LPS O-acetylase OafA/YrhL
MSDLPSLVHPPALGKMLSVMFVEHEAQAVTGFLFGIVAFQNKDRIPYNLYFFITCVLVVAGISFALDMDQGQSPILRFILMPAIAYITVFIGLTPMPLPAFFKTGDYSYGIYLYHQPFLQIVISLFPAFALAPGTGAAFTFFAGLPFVLGVAWLSWHMIEKPILALRRRYSIIAKMRGVEAAAAMSPAETSNTIELSSAE